MALSFRLGCFTVQQNLSGSSGASQPAKLSATDLWARNERAARSGAHKLWLPEPLALHQNLLFTALQPTRKDQQCQHALGDTEQSQTPCLSPPRR